MEIQRNNLHQSFILHRLYEDTQRIILLSLMLLCGVCNAETDETMSVMEGHSVLLRTNLSKILNDDTLFWAFGPKGSVISQITMKNDFPRLFFTDDVRFAGRLQVDQTTGSLTIRNTRKRHSGQYYLTISREKTTSRIFHVDVFDVVGKMDGVKSVSVIEGESVILQNDATELQKDDLIVWRFGDEGILLGKIDVETNKRSLNDADERFRNRLQLHQNGSLTITNARTENTGLYEVQIIGRASSQQFLVSVTADLGQSSAVIVGIVVAVLLVAGLLAAVVIYYRRKISKLQNQVVSVMEGRTVVLETDTKLQNGDEIKWWFEDNNKPITQISEWTITDDDIECNDTDERFRNKLLLGHKNGDLIISYIRTIHSGVYKVQICRKTRGTKYKRFIVTVSVEKVFVKVGESVPLKTDIEIKEGDVILWTFGVKKRLVVKAESGTTSISESFRGRLKLNDLLHNGSLTITNITNEEFGHFQLQVINSERNRFRRFNVIEVEEEVSVMEGRNVVLNTGTELQNGDKIKWWFEDDNKPITQNSKWTIKTTDISCKATDERFRSKLQMGGKTGDLIISYIRTIHSGVYKVQISGKTGRTKYKRFLVTVSASTGNKVKESMEMNPLLDEENEQEGMSSV